MESITMENADGRAPRFVATSSTALGTAAIGTAAIGNVSVGDTVTVVERSPRSPTFTLNGGQLPAFAN